MYLRQQEGRKKGRKKGNAGNGKEKENRQRVYVKKNSYLFICAQSRAQHGKTEGQG